MNRNLIAAILIVVVGLLGIGAYKLITKWAFAQQQVASSDAKVNTTIRVAGDGYLGYFFAVSPEMKRQAARRGMGVDFTNDGGVYAERLEKFAKGEYDCIVLPINSYIEHGLKHNYPGVIGASIADSKGADAILAFKNKLPTGKVTDLNDASLKFVYTGQSPSDFLIDLTTVDFDLYNLAKTNTWRQEVNGSTEVLERARKRDGDVFVLWEPEVSRALREMPDLTQVWGSDRFSGYIVDVFVFRRDYVKSHEADVVSFMEAYFSTMRSYRSDHTRLVEDMRVSSGLKKEEVEAGLKKIAFHDLQANCSRQFGLKTGGVENGAVEGVVNTIMACTNVLIKAGKLQKDPLGDPYRIINSGILQTVQARLPAELGSNGGTQREFLQLSDTDWKGLQEIGVMRVEPITFQQGSNALDEAGQAQVDKIAELLANNYPDARIIIKGHTSKGSDEDESVRLSQERAEVVMQRLIAVHGLSANRFKPEGKGSSQPPAKKPGENARSFMYRIPRVEFDMYLDTGF